MGEDIHYRIYLKRRKDGKYVNAHEVCSWQPEKASVFAELVEGRNYDVFSLFGSGRGNYDVLPSANYGLPDFLAGSDLDEYCKKCGFYGFIWFRPRELAEDLRVFAAKLRDPLKFYDPDSEEYAEWAAMRAPGRKTAEQMQKLHDAYVEWQDEHYGMLVKVYDLLERMARFVSRFCQRDCEDERSGGAECDPPPFGWNSSSPYSNMYDMDETVFLFFFDS